MHLNCSVDIVSKTELRFYVASFDCMRATLKLHLRESKSRLKQGLLATVIFRFIVLFPNKSRLRKKNTIILAVSVYKPETRSVGQRQRTIREERAEESRCAKILKTV